MRNYSIIIIIIKIVIDEITNVVGTMFDLNEMILMIDKKKERSNDDDDDGCLVVQMS